MVIWIAAVAIRLFLQDRLLGLPAYVYYGTPPIVLTALAVAAGLWWLAARHWKAAFPTLLLGLACGVWAYGHTWRHNPPVAPAADDVRVLFWNIAKGAGGWEQVAAEIRRLDPDIVGLVEAGRDVATMEQFWHRQLPDYQVAHFVTGIAVLARHDLVVRDASTLATWGRYAHCDVLLGDRRLNVVVADMFNTPKVSRSRCMEPIYRVLSNIADGPTLLIGDFNTPPDSVYLQRLRRDLSNAFETAGNGYAATWPLPLPVLELDQAWSSRQVRVSRCELGWTRLSDHRPIMLDLSVTPNSTPRESSPALNQQRRTSESDGNNVALPRTGFTTRHTDGADGNTACSEPPRPPDSEVRRYNFAAGCQMTSRYFASSQFWPQATSTFSGT